MEKLVKQIFKFGIVGFLCFFIDMGVFAFLNYVVGVHYLIATFFGFTISVIVNYYLSMNYVFVRKEGLDRRAEFIAFVIISIIGCGLNALIMFVCVDIIYAGWQWLNGLMSSNLAEAVAKIGATGVVMVYNFIARKIFLEQKEEILQEE